MMSWGQSDGDVGCNDGGGDDDVVMIAGREKRSVAPTLFQIMLCSRTFLDTIILNPQLNHTVCPFHR